MTNIDIPELPRGFFFNVVQGVTYYDGRHTPAKVELCKRVLGFWPQVVFTVNLTNVTSGDHPTPEHIRRGMVKALESWNQKTSIYGEYTSKRKL